MCKRLFFVLYLVISNISFSQTNESTLYTLDSLEKQFLEKNYQLLIAKYNIDIADAAIIQAKLWKNPNLTISQINFWHNNTAPQQASIIGNYGKYQQVAFDINQVIETAGKRTKRIALSFTEKNQALIDFNLLVNDLKYQLRINYYELSQIYQIKKQLTAVSDYYEKLTAAMERQINNQNLAKADAYRIKTAFIEIQQQVIEWNSKELIALKNLQILTQNPSLTMDKLAFLESTPLNLSGKIPNNITELIQDSSLLKKQAQLQLAYSEQLLKLEKAKAIPDINLLMNYDRGGNYMRDFIGFGVGIELPIYDRNQGNIKKANLQIEQQKLQVSATNISIETTINSLVKQLLEYEKILNQFPSTTMTEFQSMMENYVKHLQNRQVSIFEFVDFANSYLQSQSKFYEISKNYLETFEQIQYLSGNDL